MPGTDPPDLPVIDSPPDSGVWGDEHPTPTAEEIRVGNFLGRDIDVDDDTDNGLDQDQATP